MPRPPFPVRIPGVRSRRAASLALAAALACAGMAGSAQIEGGQRGVAPVDSSGSFEVGGVQVDVAAAGADAARYAGWRLAQRRAWAQLSTRLTGAEKPLGDGALDSIVSSIVVENEQIGPTRYIARLGVLFDRARAGAILGIATVSARSQPMLVIPVMWSGGAATVFEQRTPWQEAWARYRTGNSAIDYVRPSGTGADSLLLDAGQTLRRGRGWWRTLLAQYGAGDVLIPTVRLYRQWPGGPVIGVFEARHGPDNELLTGFALRVGNAGGLAQLLDAGVRRLDEAYQAARADGSLHADEAFGPRPGSEVADDPSIDDDAVLPDDAAATAAAIATTVSVQYESAGAAAVAATEAAVRGLPGVRSATTTSLALGGTSVMRVLFDGDPDLLRAALEARGYQVFGGGTAIRIRRAPQLLPPDLQPDNALAG